MNAPFVWLSMVLLDPNCFPQQPFGANKCLFGTNYLSGFIIMNCVPHCEEDIMVSVLGRNFQTQILCSQCYCKSILI